jgi:DNA-binding protein H-NS
MKLDMESMPLDQLWELHERISSVLSERIIAEKQELEKRLAQLSGAQAARGGAIVSLDPGSSNQTRQRRKYPQVFPKYQNPRDPDETWSGRGKQPRWLVRALSEGGKIDDYRIPASSRRMRA